jgi:D-serine deaminase-like pyridoxal phosphate-dependent protein
MMNEEHWVIGLPPGFGVRIGQEVLIVPTHVCTTVNLYAWAHVVDGTGRCVDLWEIAARGHAPAAIAQSKRGKEKS